MISQHQWTDHGTPRNADLTELEWWFQSFALLRNKIAHGGEIRSEEYLFDDGAPHHWHAEWILRKAIKQTVANAGHDEVLLNAYERAFRRALPVLEEALQEPGGGGCRGDWRRLTWQQWQRLTFFHVRWCVRSAPTAMQPCGLSEHERTGAKVADSCHAEGRGLESHHPLLRERGVAPRERLKLEREQLR